MTLALAACIAASALNLAVYFWLKTPASLAAAFVPAMVAVVLAVEVWNRRHS